MNVICGFRSQGIDKRPAMQAPDSRDPARTSRHIGAGSFACVVGGDIHDTAQTRSVLGFDVPFQLCLSLVSLFSKSTLSPISSLSKSKIEACEAAYLISRDPESSPFDTP